MAAAEIDRLPRPDVDTYFLLMATLAATRATCGRGRRGCILVDRNNHVISTGYNGVAAGMPHCLDKPCPGRNYPSGEGLHLCEALHAEENAIIQCTRPDDILTAYCTHSPCVHCVRRLMNTGTRRIVFVNEYPHAQSSKMWILSRAEYEGQTWIHHPISA